MFTMHPTLLVGLYDWDESRLPREEFAERIAAFWEQMPDESCAGVAVYGDRRNNAELGYLTHFVPKLRDGLALVPRKGETKVLVSGGANAMPPAARQTWAKVEPLSDPAKALAQWKQELGGRVALVGGDTMRSAVQRGCAEALGPDNASAQASVVLRKLMRRKRSRELAATREACAALKAAVKALGAAQRSGAGVTDSVVQAERAAHQLGVQDVRTLFSLNGGRTLRPFASPIERRVDPLQAYIAVRHCGYWAEGYVALAASAHRALAKAAEALDALVPMVKAGSSCREIARAAADCIRPFNEHPMTAGSAGSAIGLSLEEEPRLSVDGEETMEDRGVYSIRIGATDGEDAHAIVSAMIAVNERGNEVLWSSSNILSE